MKQYTFPCGCRFNIIGGTKDFPLIDFTPDTDSIPMDCQRTWDIFAAGNTKGVFQLESGQGRSTCAKLKPENMEQLSGLISILRPGCTQAKMDNKSITNHYIDRKNGIEEVSYYHPALVPALENTYGLLIYQEGAMQIVREIAGFNLQEADMLRKAMGKKKPEEMSKVKKMFTEKAKLYGVVTEEEADEIFGWIEKSQRYSFNASHAVAYAHNAYLSAYAKAHFARPFFTSYLFYAKNKQKPHEEIMALVNNAKTYGIEVVPPDFSMIKCASQVNGLIPAKNFMLRNKKIYAGFADIKGVGDSVVMKMVDNIPRVEKILGRMHTDWTWLDFLLFSSGSIKVDAFINMVSVGCFSSFSVCRQRMIYEYKALHKILKKNANTLYKIQQLYLSHRFGCLQDMVYHIIEAGVGKNHVITTKNKLAVVKDIYQSLVNPPVALNDTPDWIAGTEQSLLGVPITCTRVDTRDAGAATANCKDILTLKNYGYAIVACQIDEVKETKTKNGKNPGQGMAFLCISDTSCSLENVVVFPEQWAELSGILVQGNIVLIGGEKSKEGSFVVKKVWQI